MWKKTELDLQKPGGSITFLTSTFFDGLSIQAHFWGDFDELFLIPVSWTQPLSSKHILWEVTLVSNSSSMEGDFAEASQLFYTETGL